MKPARAGEQPCTAEVDRLVADHPFALLVSATAQAPVATPLPLLLERDTDGSAWLVGHFARNNPQLAMLRRQPRALAVFTGAHGYMSPSWLRDRTQAPTWYYATVHFDVEVELLEQETATHDALERLVAHMEAGRADAWHAAELGARYPRLAAAVVAFRARIVATHARFKLGQGERDDVLADQCAALASDGQYALLAAMDRAVAAPVSPAATRAGSPA
ncbi:MAG TPA: FMN-binding negative transcriptional regulator [Xanthomonadaceae bacterium]|nr:FMN-binding negative transcriptional regulator [Xanthomonadaceae bacterium]